jgi:ABC-2 type transport system ATP-binding protein
MALAAGSGIPASRVEDVLGLVGLDGVARRRAGTFSLGMAQRLGIAAALLGDPEVLLFDEPVNGLDPEGIRWIRTLMRSFAAEGRIVFVSSHLISEMALTADRLIVIGAGRLLADTAVAELSARSVSLEDAFLELTAAGAEHGSAVRADRPGGEPPSSGPPGSGPSGRGLYPPAANGATATRHPSYPTEWTS